MSPYYIFPAFVLILIVFIVDNQVKRKITKNRIIKDLNNEIVKS